MLFRRYFTFTSDPMWLKVFSFSLSLFFIALADAMISFWAPNLIQTSFGNSVLTGFIISFQSVIGFLADMVFPEIFKKSSVRRLTLLAIIVSGITLYLLVAASVKPFVLLFLLAMAFWGVYYELLGFARSQFIADSVGLPFRVGVCGVMDTFRNLAYFMGPLMAANFLLKGNLLLVTVASLFLLTGFVAMGFLGKHHAKPVSPEVKKMNPIQELKYWSILSEHVWPMVLVTLVLGFIESTFWTTGAVWTETLARENPLGSLFLPFFSLPSLFMGFLIVKLKIYQGKKRLSQIFLLFTGIALIGFLGSDKVVWQLVVVLISALMLSVVFPLAEGVYSDLVARLGKEKGHMIGLTSSVVNVAYIIWPPVAGFLAYEIGPRLTFVVVGVLTVVISLLLLLITPKKLKLPQKEIKTWD
jgi:hypothetical protein